MSWLDFAYRSGFLTPVEGSREWVIDDAAAGELRRHSNIDETDDDLILQFCKQALDSLDGYRGTLGIYLQSIPIVQSYSRKTRMMPVIGPVMNPEAGVLSYRENVESNDWQDLTYGREWFFVDDKDAYRIYLPRETYDHISDGRYWVGAYSNYGTYRFNNYAGGYYRYDDQLIDPRPLIRFTYTAGFGADISSLPDDLRYLIYVSTQRLYDYRDGYGPGLMQLPQSASQIFRKYRKGFTGAFPAVA